MRLKSFIIAFTLMSLLMTLSVTIGYCERTMYLNLCQELVNTARSYESRANYHSRVAKNIMSQIEAQAKLEKNAATIQTMDTLFAQYDEHRAVESQLRALYRKWADEADKCMQSVQ